MDDCFLFIQFKMLFYGYTLENSPILNAHGHGTMREKKGAKPHDDGCKKLLFIGLDMEERHHTMQLFVCLCVCASVLGCSLTSPFICLYSLRELSCRVCLAI